MNKKYFEHLNSGKLGVSSRTMLCHFMGIKNNSTFGNDTPYDPSDFQRCYQLLEKFPEFRPRLKELGGRFKKWRPLTESWEELESLLLEESPSGKCPKLYNKMKELRALRR